jgi:hypothetical protein
MLRCPPSGSIAPWLCCSLCAIVAACVSDETGGGPGTEVTRQPTQCGPTWDGEPVERLTGKLAVDAAYVARHGPSVISLGGCSGTLISNEYVITAGHCIGSSPPTRVRFNYQRDPAGATRPGTYFPVMGVVERNLGGNDYAILRVSGNPAAMFPPTPIAASDGATGDVIAIIGHPSGRPKEVATGHISGSSATRLYYSDVDTLGGNSGSGIFHAATGRLIGVHTLGGCSRTGGRNAGPKISRLLAASAVLRGLVGNAPPTPPPPGGRCAMGEQELAGRCYWLGETATTWTQASAACVARSPAATVAVVESEMENQFIADMIETQSHWLGGADRTAEGNWTWMGGRMFWTGGNGGRAPAGAFAAFMPGEPNEAVTGSDCLRVVIDGGWRDTPCDSQLPAVCERPL